MAGKTVSRLESMPQRLALGVVFGAMAYALYWLKGQGAPDLKLSAEHSLLDFASRPSSCWPGSSWPAWR